MPEARSTRPPLSRATEVFGQRVRQHRKNLGLTQEKLAEQGVLHWSYIGQVERGQTNLTLHNILLIADVLGVDPGELVTGLPSPD